MKKIKTAAMATIIFALWAGAAAADSGWRLVSAPCHSGFADIAALFAEAPDAVFEAAPGSGYLQSFSGTAPGKAYWMKFAAEPMPAGGCMTISAPTFDIQIKPGWNMIGNPFVRETSLPAGWPPAYEYFPASNSYAEAQTLKPWKGYFIKAPADCGSGCAMTLSNPDRGRTGARADAPKLARVVACPAAGDADGNGIVDAADLFVISQYYGTAITASSPTAARRADTDGNGIVDASDVFAVSRNYGDTCAGGIANNPPVANSQSASTAQGAPLVILLTGSDPDGDALSYSIVSNPSNGTLDISALPTVTYSPGSEFYGVDMFTFRVSDGSMNSLSAAVTITVTQSSIPGAQTVSNVTVAPDPHRRHSSLIVRWDPPTDTSINAFDIYCNGDLVNPCPEMLHCFSGMSCDPAITYSYYINIPTLQSAPADPSAFECEVSVRAMSIDESANLIAKQSQLSAAVAASTFSHIADSPYAGGVTAKAGAPTDCSSIRNQGRIACSGESTVVLPNARIQAWRKETSSESPSGTLVATVYSNAQGYYEFSTLDPGYYNFIAYHDNGTTQTDDDVYSILESVNIQPAPFNVGGFNNLGEMKLEETGSIYGRVRLALDSTGENLLETPNDAYLGIDVYVPGTSFTAKTNRSGEFYILYLPPTTYSLVASANNYAIAQRDGIEVESKQITTVTPDITLLASIGSVVGTASFADSSNDGDASVALIKTGESAAAYTTSTLADGSFSFTGVEVGSYSISVIRYGWQPYSQPGVAAISNTTTNLGVIGPIPRIPGPFIADISPTSGDNDADTQITIDGSNFGEDTLFYIKKGLTSAQLQSIVFVSDEQMTAVVPAGYDWGAYDISAVNPDAQSVTLSEVFNVTLSAPEPQSLSAASMDNTAPLELTITGAKLVGGSSVRIGGALTNGATVNSAGTSLSTIIPAGLPPGTYDVTVTNPDSAAREAVLANAFTVNALMLILIEPSTLSVAAGSQKQFAASCVYTDSATSTVSVCTDSVVWHSSNPSIGTIGSSSGLFASLSFGQTYVTAQRGSVVGGPVAVSVFNPASIFQDAGLVYGSANDYQSHAVAADLNGNGYIDMINSNDGNNRVFINNGSGAMSANGQFTCISMATNGQSFTVADINGDSHLDVVCDGFRAGYGQYTFGFKNTNGDAAAWGVTTMMDLGARQRVIVSGDLNMNGRIDIAAASAADGSIAVLFSNGDGTFNYSSQPNLDSGGEVWSLAVGDVNGDGFNDIVAGVWGGPNKVWLNNGYGYFTDSGQSLGDHRTTVILLSDFNADGSLDIFEGNGGFLNEYAQPDRIWLNNGGGVFTDSGQSMPSALTTAASAVDIDNDGDTDIIVGIGQGGFNRFLLNDGAGNFTDSGQRLSPTYTNNLAAADFTGNTKIDFIEGTLSGLWNFTGGHGGIPSNNQPLSPTILSESVIDIEGDEQFNDVVLTWNPGFDMETPTELLTYNIAIVRSDGMHLRSFRTPVGPGNAGAANTITLNNLPIGSYRWRVQTVDTGFRKSEWSADSLFTTGMRFEISDDIFAAGDTGAVLAVDVNGDGHIDIIEGRNTSGGGANIVWLNDGAGGFVQHSSFGASNTKALAAADLNGNGHIDIVDAAKGPNRIWFNDGTGNFADAGQDLGEGDTAAVAIADFDLDGRLDIFIGNTGSPSMIYKNIGNGEFRPGSEVDDLTRIEGAQARDINNDGAPDLVLAAMHDGVMYYLNDGYGLLEYWRKDTSPRAIKDISVADVIGDDLLDDVFVGQDNFYIDLLRNNVTYFTGNLISNDRMNTVAIDVADMDADGALDVVVMNSNQPPQVLLGRGGFNYDWIDQSGLPDAPATGLALADFNGDGSIDIAVSVADGMNSSRDFILFNKQVKANAAPLPPAGLSAQENGNVVTLTWGAGSDAETAADRLTYDIRARASSGGDWLRPAAPIPSHGPIGGNRTLIIRNAPSGQYEWEVRTIDAGMLVSDWTSGPSFNMVADADPPVFDGLQSAVNAELGETVRLAWNSATDASPPIAYNVYLATFSGGQNFGAPDSTTYNASIDIAGLTDWQEYCFVVRAADNSTPPNESTNLEELCATPTPDVTPPTFGGLTGAASGPSPSSVSLTWNLASDTNGPVTYNIYYSTESGGQNFAAPDATTTDDTGIILTGLTQLETYFFIVRAMDASPASNEDDNAIELSATATGIPKVLLVDADGGSAYENYFKNALANIGLPYTHHDRVASGVVTPALLGDYLGNDQIVIWFSGNSSTQNSVMNADEQTAVINFLNAGGNLFANGHEFGYALSSRPVYGYFGVVGDWDIGGLLSLDGVPGDPISDSLNIAISGGDGANNQTWRSRFNLNGATACYIYTGSANIGCARYDTGVYRTVYFAFGFEAINNQPNRNAVMQRVYDWLTQ